MLVPSISQHVAGALAVTLPSDQFCFTDELLVPTPPQQSTFHANDHTPPWTQNAPSRSPTSPSPSNAMFDPESDIRRYRRECSPYESNLKISEMQPSNLLSPTLPSPTSPIMAHFGMFQPELTQFMSDLDFGGIYNPATDHFGFTDPFSDLNQQYIGAVSDFPGAQANLVDHLPTFCTDLYSSPSVAHSDPVIEDFPSSSAGVHRHNEASPNRRSASHVALPTALASGSSNRRSGGRQKGTHLAVGSAANASKMRKITSCWRCALRRDAVSFQTMSVQQLES
jgi:hypothetical protein